MTLPPTWARLPGPANLIETIADDLAEEVVVVVGVAESANDFLAEEVAEYTFDAALGDWLVIPFDEEVGTPAAIVDKAYDSARSPNSVLWVQSYDAERVKCWLDYLRIMASVDTAPRACISAAPAIASEVSSQPGMRTRLWDEFVTAIDSFVLVERDGRKIGLSRAHLELKAAVVAALAGGDIAYANQLARWKLSRIIDDTNYPRDRLWAGQVGVLMTMVDRQRQRLLHRYQGLWTVPHTQKDGRVISVQDRLEIGDMAAQANLVGIPRKDAKFIQWLNRIRRAMAHNEPVRWGTLVSAAALSAVDFTG